MPTDKKTEQITEAYEAKHLRNIAKVQKAIETAYFDIVDKAIVIGLRARVTKGRFKFALNREINREVDKLLAGFRQTVEVTIENGIDKSWQMSVTKRLEIAEARFPGISDKLRDIIADPRANALKAFKSRRVAGLKLSSRVWNLSAELKETLEDTIQRGIADGISADKLARQTKQYLKEPNRVFRRVRNKKGKLVASEPMKKYKPGQGVYKSSLQNAKRMAATETNTAYRESDSASYAKDPLVKAIEIRLSDAHPKTDVCDYLKGIYPANYIFRGNHPRCLCYVVPVLVNDKEFNAIEDAILDGRPVPDFRVVKDIPDSAKQWLTDNAERIARLKNEPMFVSGNEKYVSSFLQK